MRIVALLAALFASMWPQPQTATTTKSFTISAHQWAFDITPPDFTVNQGDTVTLDLTSTDVTHGFFLEGSGVSVTLLPGKHVTATFVANAPGQFGYFCTEPSCGAGHGNMGGTFVVNAQGQPPSVTTFTPSSGPAAGGTVVLITGTNFQNGATVKFGATPAVSTTFNSSTSLSAVAPAHGSAGAVTLSVTNPDGQSVSAGTYTYFAPPVTGPKRRAVRQHG